MHARVSDANHLLFGVTGVNGRPFCSRTALGRQQSPIIRHGCICTRLAAVFLHVAVPRVVFIYGHFVLPTEGFSHDVITVKNVKRKQEAAAMLDYKMVASMVISASLRRHLEYFYYALNRVEYHCFLS